MKTSSLLQGKKKFAGDHGVHSRKPS